MLQRYDDALRDCKRALNLDSKFAKVSLSRAPENR
jgi:hypothetical protein